MLNNRAISCFYVCVVFRPTILNSKRSTFN